MKTCRRVALLTTTFGLALGLTSVAQAVPTLRFKADQKGDFVLFGNTVGFDCAAGTPAPIVDRLYTEIARILKTPDIQKRLTDLGLNISEMTPAQLTALIRSDVPRLGKIVKESGAKAD